MCQGSIGYFKPAMASEWLLEKLRKRCNRLSPCGSRPFGTYSENRTLPLSGGCSAGFSLRACAQRACAFSGATRRLASFVFGLLRGGSLLEREMKCRAPALADDAVSGKKPKYSRGQAFGGGVSLRLGR